jgi:hypothetical protein
MPNKLTPSPRELISSNWFVVISGGSNIRCTASKTMKTDIRMRNIPLANPDKVSIRPYPYVNRSSGGHLAMIEASKPTPIAKQSKAIWIASEMRPKLFVQTPYSI